MVKPVFIEDDDVLASPGLVKTPWDPACGTAGMACMLTRPCRRF